MPRNPLLNLPANTSQSRVEDRPAPLTPVEERYAGSNHPYRGIETHGVPDTDDPDMVPGYDTRAAVVYEDTPSEIDPVPVRVVQEGGREFRQARVSTGYAGSVAEGNAVAILPRDDTRTKATIKNMNTAIVYIVTDQQSQAFCIQNGFPLQQFAQYETLSQDAVYVAVDNATSVKVNVITEYSTPL